ncbi:MAG: DNA repair protein RecO [Candidatus Staskawiczbacteria bacterium]|jgi:DNA repair protein RecO (recombination protein O)
MALKYRTQGFIFKKDERAESDQTFAVFTKDFGRLELKAKAIRKITSKLRADIDIFYFSEIEFIQGKNNKTLTDASKIKKFDEIVLDFQKLKVANQISEILDGFIKGQEKDEPTFDLLNEIFDNLTGGANIKNHELAFQYFFWNFISLQGYNFQTQNCAVCKEKLNPENIYFSTKEGGIICGNCAKSKKNCPEPCQRINSDIVKILRLIFKKDWNIISKLKVEPNSQKLLEDISQTAIHTFCPVHC